MRYFNGLEVNVGDKVTLGNEVSGEVVCSIDSNEFSPQFPRAEWDYLKQGVLVNFSKYGLIHYAQPEPDLCFVERAASKVEK